MARLESCLENLWWRICFQALAGYWQNSVPFFFFSVGLMAPFQPKVSLGSFRYPHSFFVSSPPSSNQQQHNESFLHFNSLWPLLLPGAGESFCSKGLLWLDQAWNLGAVPRNCAYYKVPTKISSHTENLGCPHMHSTSCPSLPPYLHGAPTVLLQHPLCTSTKAFITL